MGVRVNAAVVAAVVSSVVCLTFFMLVFWLLNYPEVRPAMLHPLPPHWAPLTPYRHSMDVPVCCVPDSHQHRLH